MTRDIISIRVQLTCAATHNSCSPLVAGERICAI